MYMHLQVTYHFSNVVMAGGLLLGDEDSLAHGAQEGAATVGKVSGVANNHLHSFNLTE